MVCIPCRPFLIIHFQLLILNNCILGKKPLTVTAFPPHGNDCGEGGSEDRQHPRLADGGLSRTGRNITGVTSGFAHCFYSSGSSRSITGSRRSLAGRRCSSNLRYLRTIRATRSLHRGSLPLFLLRHGRQCKEHYRHDNHYNSFHNIFIFSFFLISHDYLLHQIPCHRERCTVRHQPSLCVRRSLWPYR